MLPQWRRSRDTSARRCPGSVAAPACDHAQRLLRTTRWATACVQGQCQHWVSSMSAATSARLRATSSGSGVLSSADRGSLMLCGAQQKPKRLASSPWQQHHYVNSSRSASAIAERRLSTSLGCCMRSQCQKRSHAQQQQAMLVEVWCEASDCTQLNEYHVCARYQQVHNHYVNLQHQLLKLAHWWHSDGAVQSTCKDRRSGGIEPLSLPAPTDLKSVPRTI